LIIISSAAAEVHVGADTRSGFLAGRTQLISALKHADADFFVLCDETIVGGAGGSRPGDACPALDCALHIGGRHSGSTRPRTLERRSTARVQIA
jgi:hypothetical protein